MGRQSRRSMIQADLAMPTNLKDPASNVTYFEAAQQLVRLITAGTPTAQVPRIPYWENLFPGAATATLTATQSIFNAYRVNRPDWITALFDMDIACDPACSRFGPNAFFSPQFSALAAFRSIAGGNYHAMQWTVRKRFSGGSLFDFSYTWGKSIDLGSGTEREGSFSSNLGLSSSFVENSWFPGQRKGVSDYDTTQQWNLSYVWELPSGRGKKWAGGIGRPLDAVLGGWQLAGLWRQTTELPISVGNGRNWPTNWNLTGRATQSGIVPTPTKTKNAPAVAGSPGPNLFADPRVGLAAYDFTVPGESGQRNGLRGDGFFTIDLGVGKRFQLPYAESHSLQFRWETFNLTNRSSSRSPSL